MTYKHQSRRKNQEWERELQTNLATDDMNRRELIQSVKRELAWRVRQHKLACMLTASCNYTVIQANDSRMVNNQLANELTMRPLIKVQLQLQFFESEYKNINASTRFNESARIARWRFWRISPGKRRQAWTKAI